jgi:SWI/SNF-related matrix-associated actin-dependent regulator 1 of chromatin subfamily A
MVRRLKKDVLAELPPKRRQVIELPSEGVAKKAASAEMSEWQKHELLLDQLRAAVDSAKEAGNQDEYRRAVADLRGGIGVAFAAMSKVRQATAIAKIPYVIEHVRDAIESGPVVLFAYHHAVIEKLVEEFGDRCVSFTGRHSATERQGAVDAFQRQDGPPLFIGSIAAAGVGITLTRASHVIFAELDWVPGNMSQCEDRCHRIGQADSVIVQHLVLEGSLDSVMAHKLIQKQEVIDLALDESADVCESADVFVKGQL